MPCCSLQVVSAVSDTPEGPFVRHGIEIPPWSHNPQAIRTADGTWVIYTLGPGLGHQKEVNCDKSSPTADPPPQQAAAVGPVNFTMHSAASPHGPWTATTLSPRGWNASWTMQTPGNWNPAPVLLEDGSVRVMAHTDPVGDPHRGPWAGEVILEAPSWKGPYTVKGSDLIDHCDYCEEDPFMWKDKRGNWHVLYHRMFDPAGPLDPQWGKWSDQNKPKGSPVPSPGWAGGHAFSRDGYTWSNWTRCYNTSVVVTNGTHETTVEHSRRERPKLLFNKEGQMTHLYNGAFDALGSPVTFTIVAPIKLP